MTYMVLVVYQRYASVTPAFYAPHLLTTEQMTSTFLNSYRRPSPDLPRDLHLHIPAEEYDHNYVFEVKTLRSDRVELRPYVVSHPVYPSSAVLSRESFSHPCMQSRCLRVSRRTPRYFSGWVLSPGQSSMMSSSGPRRSAVPHQCVAHELTSLS